MPVQFEKNVINFFPVTAAREMTEPAHRLKFAGGSSYYDQMRVAVPKLVKDKGAKKVCTIYQDDEFGLEVFRGAEAGLKAVNLDFTEKTTYKRGATDFSSQVARMKAAGCEMVVLGTIIRETIGTIAEGRKTGFNPVFLGSSATYTDLIHKLGKKAMDGLYATHTVQHPYLDEASPEDPVLGQEVPDQVRRRPDGVLGLRLLGDRHLHRRGAEGRSEPDDRQLHQGDGVDEVPARHVRLGRAEPSADQRAGSDMTRMSQLQDERWKPVTDYVKPQ